MLDPVLLRSRMRYGLSRWVIPRLGPEPLAVKNLAQNAWPKIAAFTSSRELGDRIESIDWLKNGADDGTETLEEYAAASKPVVLKGYTKNKTNRPWDFERVKEEVGDTKVKVRVGDYASTPGEAEYVRMRAAEFLDYLSGQTGFAHRDRLVNGLGPYLANVKLPKLAADLPCPEFFSDSHSTTFWIGANGSRTHLHCHQHADVLLLQLYGRRKLALVPPHQALLVGYMPVNVNICTASFDPFAADADDHPGRASLDLMVCDLEPGDALLIPGFWFHAVELSEPSMSASHFEDRMPRFLGGGPVAPWRTRQYRRGW